MRKTSKKKKKVGKPNGFLWWFAIAFLRPWYRLRYGLRVDRTAVKNIKGPALILAPHISGKDHVIVGITMYPSKPTFVLSEHFMSHPLLRFFLKRLHVVTKKMFCADTHTIMSVLRAKSEGNLIVLFPEGRLPACAHSLAVTPGTAELIKKLGIDVYTVTGNGAALTFPKWGKCRRGKIRVETAKLLCGTDLTSMSIAEIQTKVEGAIAHDDEAAMAGVTYRCRDTTAGLDGLLRRCPLCGVRGKLLTGGGHIRCECGLDATLDRTYRLHGAPFATPNAWFDWQQTQIDPEKEIMDEDMMVGAIDRKGNMCRTAGHGHATMNTAVFSFTGTVFDAPVSFTIPTDKIGAFPVTVAQHFDIYNNNILYHMYPQKDRRTVIDWVCYLDRLNALRETARVRGLEAPREGLTLPKTQSETVVALSPVDREEQDRAAGITADEGEKKC